MSLITVQVETTDLDKLNQTLAAIGVNVSVTPENFKDHLPAITTTFQGLSSALKAHADGPHTVQISTRDGEVATVTLHVLPGDRPVLGWIGDQVMTWLPNGRYQEDFESGCDLILGIPASPPQEQPEPPIVA